MSISAGVKIKGTKLPASPGVYLFKGKQGRVVYVGKATNLKVRVNSYFRRQPTADSRQLGRAIDAMLHEVREIDWLTTDSVMEALILEANLIRKYMPKYNVREKDDKSFLYVTITKEAFPKVQLMRGNEVGKFLISNFQFLNKSQIPNPKFLKVFGPYTSASAIRAALDLLRKWFPWSTCKPTPHLNPPPQGGRKYKRVPLPRWEGLGEGVQLRPCFDYHIGRCPGVCIGAISRREYMKNIRNVIRMLSGRKARVLKNVEHAMKQAAREEHFEEAEALKRKLFALRHIRDVAVISSDYRLQTIDYSPHVVNVLGRIEGYDISNISGTSAVGSMVVFQDGEPAKSEYKRFKIKTVRGINDVAMMREVLMRRFAHSIPPPRWGRTKEGVARLISHPPQPLPSREGKNWPLPDLLVIDGGWGQVNAAREVIRESATKRRDARLLVAEIPVIGIAKGFKRKQDRPIFNKDNPELARIVANYKDLLLRVRDEAHRFAVAYHRKLRSKRGLST